MANDDVLIIGKLEDKALIDSIDNLINEVSNKSTEMANKFKGAMDIMTNAMKDFAISQKVSVELMKESWREMSAAFDAMFKAQSEGSGGGRGSGRAEYDDATIGKLKQEIALIKQERDDMKLNTEELTAQNQKLAERQNLLKQQTTSIASMRLDRALQMPSKDLDEASKKLRMLEILQRRYADTTGLSVQEQKRLERAIVQCKKEIDRLNSSKPKTLKEVMGMDESSLDAIAKKMRALRLVNVDPNSKTQLRDIGNEYARLGRLQAELMGKNIQLTHSNNYLAQSFGYIRNRIVYALTLGAVTKFTKQIYDVRGQYELLERSLGILIDDMRRGSELFNELNAMALKSPFTLMELATGAKQLLAYNFAEDEVVDTTRRLADISAALGVPMERLVYNLGQIRAQTALTARDARDFANAGLAIVPMLAEMYTKEKRFGDELVTTSQVFDMMSKKMVSYADVMKVINKVTDEGGKFYDFQAKQADTLKVKMANLTLAWNNMLNEIGERNQTALALPLKGLKLLFENWQSVYKIMRDVLILYGIFKVGSIYAAVSATFSLATSMKSLGAATRVATANWKMLSAAVYANPFAAVASVVAACAASFLLFSDNAESASEYQEKFGKAGAKVVREAEDLFDSLGNMTQGTSNYKKVMSELNSILGEYNIEQIKETDSIGEVNKKRESAISLIKQETLERKHLNDVQQGRDDYNAAIANIRNQLRENLSDAITENFLGIGTVNEEIKKKAPAIANIVSDIIEKNISAIAGKTGDEYEKGVKKIFAEIESRMYAIGISEETRSKGWLKNSVFRMFEDDIVTDAIEQMVEAKQKMDDYTDAIDKNYEAEKKAAEQGATFNDRVAQTQNELMKASTDTDKFARKIEDLLKQYGGQNIIKFLVDVKANVPEWMKQKSLKELTTLAARFASLATNTAKAGKDALNVNGKLMTTQQLFERAAQYKQAAENKAADIESRKSTKLTQEASDALKDYKQALEAERIAQNLVNRGKRDATLLTEKQTESQKAYTKALEKGVSMEELQKAKNGGKGKGGSKKDPLGDALTKEIQLISDIQKMYKEYQKAGVDADTARIASAREYEKTLKATNAILAKFGIDGLSAEELATMDARSLRDYYVQLRDIANMKGNTKGVEALEKAIRSLNVEITKIDYKKITEGLNNELNKLKDDYELAVELDANPELGNMFADMFNIDTSALPRTFEQALEKTQSVVNDALRDLNIAKPFNVMKDDLEVFAKEVGQSLDGDAYKGLENAQNYIRNLWKKTTSDTIKDWNTLLEKYGDYQAKMVRIAQETAQEQTSLIRKFGTVEEQAEALDLSSKITLSTDPQQVSRLQKQLAELLRKVVAKNAVATKVATSVQQADARKKSQTEWDAFKNSEMYALMFEDMDRVSTRAIQNILAQLDVLKNKVKDDPASMKALMDAYKKGRDELESRAPFENIIVALKEMRQATIDAAEARKELDAANKEYENAQNAVNNLQSRGGGGKGSGVDYTERLAKAQERLKKATEAKNNAEIKSANAEIRQINAQKKFQNALNNSATCLENVGGLLQQFAELLGITEDSEAGEMVKSLAQGFSMVATALSMVAAASALAEMSLGWVAAAAAALAVVAGTVSFLAGSHDRQIEQDLKSSELAVKRLENSYKNLERAVENAYGASQVAARKAVIANKELQLVELQRQLQLEKSKSSKKRDADKIADLEGQIIDMKNEIQDMRNEITNSFLGISSVADVVKSMVDDIVSALRNGEDAMAGFNDSIDDMIANMIKQVFSARILGPMLEKIWSKIDEDIQSRGEKYASYVAQYQTTLDHIMTNTNDTGEGYYFWKDASGTLFYSNNWMRQLEASMQEGFQVLTYKQWKDIITGWQEWSQNALEEATTPTMNDVRTYASQLRNVSPELEAYLGELENILREMGLIKDTTKEQSLSKLQQGISGITEDTAGAIEAYMNIVSQRIFEQNITLEQIRDAILGFNLDVQVATASQMLLQLQQSYQVQQSIENILQNVLTPTGRAFTVELAS